MPDWQSNLEDFFKANDESQGGETIDEEEARTKSSAYFSGTVVPALIEIEFEIEKYGREVMVWGSADQAYVDVTYEGEREIKYFIKTNLPNLRPYTEIHSVDSETGRVVVLKGIFRIEKQTYTLDDVTKDVIINDFLSVYYAHHS